MRINTEYLIECLGIVGKNLEVEADEIKALKEKVTAELDRLYGLQADLFTHSSPFEKYILTLQELQEYVMGYEVCMRELSQCIEDMIMPTAPPPMTTEEVAKLFN